MMETFFWEETISHAKIVSGTVSRLLEAMAIQFHSLLNSNQEIQYKVTVFDLRTVPDIQLWDYIFRIMTMSKCIYRDLIAALVYVDTLINSGVISGISFNNIHRLVALSMMTSTKFFDDVHYSNASWSKIVGIPLRELNSAEITFLQSLNFDVNIKFQTLQTWSEWITRFADENPNQEREIALKTEERAQEFTENNNQEFSDQPISCESINSTIKL